jgi:hypothetical protein
MKFLAQIKQDSRAVFHQIKLGISAMMHEGEEDQEIKEIRVKSVMWMK